MDKVYHMIENTAWQMQAPTVFGSFHLIALALTITLAVVGAHYFAAWRNDKVLVRILSIAGWILVVLEIYKQLFIFHVIGNDDYNWWYFPFQLCSIPMYLCISLPLTYGKLRDTFLCFMASYSLVGALAALIYPEDFLRPYVMLTLHGFLWHGILLFISLSIYFSAYSKISPTILSTRSFIQATFLFTLLCIIAICINVSKDTFMFYMNPFRLSPQPIVNTVQQSLGIPIGLFLYAIVIAIVSFVMMKLLSHLFHHKSSTIKKQQ